MSIYDELEALAAGSRQAYKRGLVSGTGGNTSLRQGQALYISPSGSVLGELQAADFLALPLDPQWRPGVKEPLASKEALLHIMVYLARPDVQAIFHLHPVDCIAAGLLLEPGELLPAYVPGLVKKLGRVPQIDYYPAGSQQLAAAAAAAMTEHNCVLLRRHGSIVVGKNVAAAYARAEDLTDACRLHCLLRGSVALSEAEITAIGR